MPRRNRSSQLCIVLAGLALTAGMDSIHRTLAGGNAGSDAPGGNLRVLYVTNRARSDDADLLLYGGERGPVRYGECVVTFSPIPLLSEVSPYVPFYLPDESLSAQALEYAGAQRFWREIGARVETSEAHRLVLFVHGYSFGFEKGCGRAAALQRALGATHTVVLFTWPSDAQAAEYTSDYTDMTWAVPDLAALLAELRQRLGVGRVQVVAHSMGARGTVEAIHWLGCRADDGAGQVDQLVLLAPDMDAAIFQRYQPWLAAFAGRITVYVSGHDTPLKVSGQLHGHPRLGEAGPHLAASAGVEIVDVSAMGRYHVTGHEYYHYHPVVRSDLVRLLTTGQPAPLRPGLIRRTDYGSHYWVMVPATDL